MEADTDNRVPHFGSRPNMLTHAKLLQQVRDKPDLVTTGTVRFLLQLENLGRSLYRDSGASMPPFYTMLS